MKLQHTLVALLCMGAFAAPVLAVGPLTDQAVSLAAPDSKASIDAIALATFEAVKESPDEADVVFAKVLEQRTNWTASEVYTILRAVFLARPDLQRPFTVKIAEGDGDRTPVGASSVDPMIYKLLNVLVDSSLSEGVVRTVVDNMNMNALGLIDINARYAHGDVGAGVNGLNINRLPGQADYREDRPITTPDDTSKTK